MFLVQSALNGRLVAAQPALTLTDPVVSILWGVLVFGERVRTGWFLALTVAGGLLIIGAVLVLAWSPRLSDPSEQKERSPGQVAGESDDGGDTSNAARSAAGGHR